MSHSPKWHLNPVNHLHEGIHVKQDNLAEDLAEPVSPSSPAHFQLLAAGQSRGENMYTFKHT